MHGKCCLHLVLDNVLYALRDRTETAATLSAGPVVTGVGDDVTGGLSGLVWPFLPGSFTLALLDVGCCTLWGHFVKYTISKRENTGQHKESCGIKVRKKSVKSDNVINVSKSKTYKRITHSKAGPVAGFGTLRQSNVQYLYRRAARFKV